MAWRFELDTPVFSNLTRTINPSKTAVEDIVNNKIKIKQKHVRDYYDPIISEIDEEIERLLDKKRGILRERDQQLKEIENQDKIVEIQNECLICCCEEASEELDCGHRICEKCLERIDVCPFDRNNIH